jgi:putative SOS response-associated peptidase YedK
MPPIIAPADYVRWLSDEPDPHDLMRAFPAEPMRMWPISTGSTSLRMTIARSSSQLSYPLRDRMSVVAR